MFIKKKELRSINKLSEYGVVKKVVIFGSAARTCFKKYKDLDILLVLDKNDLKSKYHNTLSMIEKEYNTKPIAIKNEYKNIGPLYKKSFTKYHIFYCNENELNNMSNPLLRNIHREGLIYN